MKSDDGVALSEFVIARYPELRRSAFLMCGDWALAGVRTQRSLARLVAARRRRAVRDPDSFVYAHLMTSFLRHPLATTPAAPAERALAALWRLSPRPRAVLVLRRWEGFSVAETANILGMTGRRVEAYEAAGVVALDCLPADREPAAA